MIRESLLDFAQANSRLKLAGLITLSEKQAHLYSQIEGAVVSGKQLTNAGWLRWAGSRRHWSTGKPNAIKPDVE